MRRAFLLIMLGIFLANCMGAAARQILTVIDENTGREATDAIVYASGGLQATYCNTSPRTMTITTEVHVAQWLRTFITQTQWNWYVRKPGTYYTNCISLTIQSNGAVGVQFSGFDNLQADAEVVNPVIETWYGWSPDEAGPAGVNFCGWYAAPELNEKTFIYEDSLELHQGITYKLWNRIKVVDCNSPATYRNTGTISFILLNQKEWIDPETGDFQGEATQRG